MGGVWSFEKLSRKASTRDQRLTKLREHLNGFAGELDVIAYEKVVVSRFIAAMLVLASYETTLKIWCLDHGVQLVGYTPKEIKKYTTGSGNATKEEMTAAAEAKFGKVVDHNHADALHILDMAMHGVAPEHRVKKRRGKSKKRS